MRERGWKTCADWQRERRNCSVKRREGLRSWVTQLNWCCWPQLTVLSLERQTDRKKDRLLQSWAHSPPELAQPSPPSAFWEKAEKIDAGPAATVIPAHKWHYRPICKIDTRFVFHFIFEGKDKQPCLFAFLFTIKSTPSEQVKVQHAFRYRSSLLFTKLWGSRKETTRLAQSQLKSV